jgi:hypothetical protein
MGEAAPGLLLADGLPEPGCSGTKSTGKGVNAPLVGPESVSRNPYKTTGYADIAVNGRLRRADLAGRKVGVLRGG